MIAGVKQKIEELPPSWSMAPVVTALQAMRGVALLVAVTVVAEVGDFRRLGNACCLSRRGLAAFMRTTRIPAISSVASQAYRCREAAVHRLLLHRSSIRVSRRSRCRKAPC
jgi:hypothetical protein